MSEEADKPTTIWGRFRRILSRQVDFPEILNEFAGETTAHGIPFVITKRSIFQKCIWACLVTTAFIIFCVEASSLISAFYTFHTNVEFVTSESIEFPEVTICNFNRMKRSSMIKTEKWKSPIEYEEYWKGVGELDDYNWLWGSDYGDYNSSSSDQLKGPSRSKRDALESDYSDWWYYSYDYLSSWESLDDLMEKLLDPLSITKYIIPTKEDLKTLGHQAEDFIRECTFNGRSCNYSNFHSSQNKIYGNCFTFNSSGFAGGKISKVGETLGLHLTLFIEFPEYVGFLTEESGVRIAIHPKKTYPFPEDIGISLAPGYVTSIGLRQVELRRLPSPHGQCTDGKKSDHLQSDNYHYTAISCQKKCYLKSLIKECGCVDNIYDDFLSTDQCALNTTNCQQLTEQKFRNNSLGCHCPVPCREFVYNMKISSAAWPSEMYQHRIRDIVNKSNDDTVDQALWNDIEVTRKNLVRVKVYYEELNYELIEQIKTYTLSTMLSSFGGLLGLFLGFSLITVFEVVVLAFRVIKTIVMKYYNK